MAASSCNEQDVKVLQIEDGRSWKPVMLWVCVWHHCVCLSHWLLLFLPQQTLHHLTCSFIICPSHPSPFPTVCFFTHASLLIRTGLEFFFWCYALRLGSTGHTARWGRVAVPGLHWAHSPQNMPAQLDWPSPAHLYVPLSRQNSSSLRKP